MLYAVRVVNGMLKRVKPRRKKWNGKRIHLMNIRRKFCIKASTNKYKPGSIRYRYYNSNGIIFRSMRRMNEFAKKHPLIFAVTFASSRYTLCDVIFGQQGIEGRVFKDINWERAFLFTLFGFFYSGAFQYGLYSKFYPLIFDRIKVPIYRAVTQTAVDMCIHSPFLYMPAYYVFKKLVYERKMNRKLAKEALHQYFYVNFRDDIKHLFIVWTPIIFMAFMVIPTRLRVPWIDLCGMGWITWMSVARGEKDDAIEEEE